MVVRILFVDDEWDELEQLRKLTRPMHQVWDMSFACGSTDALRHLASESHPPDVVITELHLSGMDGIDLLKAIQATVPKSIRLLHSASSSTGAICRAIPWAHQFLKKPLRLDELEGTINQLRGDPSAHDRHIITQLAGSVATLPALPATYQRVVDIAERDDFSLREISDAIQDDVALTAATMKLVNSSFFGLRSDVTSIEQAVSLLGLDVIRGLLLANSLFSESPSSAPWLDLARLAERSRTVAALARALAKVDGNNSRDQALSFLSGMVHGAGLLLLSRSRSVDLPTATGIEASIDPDVDIRLFGVDRYALGAYLLRLWGFETTIVEAVAGLAVEPQLMVSPVARALRAANELVAWGGFSVPDFVDADRETLALVAAMRTELDKRFEPAPATAA